jgi:hypothetical protein
MNTNNLKTYSQDRSQNAIENRCETLRNTLQSFSNDTLTDQIKGATEVLLRFSKCGAHEESVFVMKHMMETIIDNIEQARNEGSFCHCKYFATLMFNSSNRMYPNTSSIGKQYIERLHERIQQFYDLVDE